jgi:hypothetical protein
MVKTYFLYTRTESGLIDDFVANVFEEEIEETKISAFEINDKVEIMEEDTFRMIHPEEYYEDFYNNWTDYVDTLLEKHGYVTDIHNPDVPDDDYEKTETYDINKDIIDVLDICIITKDKDDIFIRFDIEANPVDVAYIMQQLIKHTETVFEIVVDEYIHAKVTDNGATLYYGADAVTQYFNDKLLQYDLN